jgi:hypothetical protein
MSNTAPVPVLITPHFQEVAAAQGIHMVTADGDVLNQVYDDTRRPELKDASAITIGASRTIGGDKPSEATLDGAYIAGGPRGTGEAGNKGGVDDAHTVHLQVDHKKPITTVGLTEQLTETLLVPARMRRTITSGIGTLCVAASALSETTSYAIYNAHDGHFTPGSLAWMAGGAVALVGGAVELGRGIVQGRRINAARAAAMQRRPFRLQ